jgi:hypothetical protein
LIDLTGSNRSGIVALNDAVGLMYEAALDPALWPMGADDEAQLIEAIYDAVLDYAVLDDVLARVRTGIAASISCMFAYDADGPTRWHLYGLDATALVPYAEHYHHFDDFKDAPISRAVALRHGIHG